MDLVIGLFCGFVLGFVLACELGFRTHRKVMAQLTEALGGVIDETNVILRQSKR